MSNSNLSKENFIVIISLLVRDLEFRKKFFEDPIATLKERNFTLSESELTALKNISFPKDDKVSHSFNEGLVLCSSSGY